MNFVKCRVALLSIRASWFLLSASGLGALW